MGTVRTDGFRKDAARIALSNGLSQRQVADDLGVGLSTLNKWVAEAHAVDDRPHAAKAISMTVRATGKRNAALRAAALGWVDRGEPRGRIEARLARDVLRDLV